MHCLQVDGGGPLVLKLIARRAVPPSLGPSVAFCMQRLLCAVPCMTGPRALQHAARCQTLSSQKGSASTKWVWRHPPNGFGGIHRMGLEASTEWVWRHPPNGSGGIHQMGLEASTKWVWRHPQRHDCPGIGRQQSLGSRLPPESQLCLSYVCLCKW